jgi:hypothetical protein
MKHFILVRVRGPDFRFWSHARHDAMQVQASDIFGVVPVLTPCVSWDDTSQHGL